MRGWLNKTTYEFQNTCRPLQQQQLRSGSHISLKFRLQDPLCACIIILPANDPSSLLTFKKCHDFSPACAIHHSIREVVTFVNWWISHFVIFGYVMIKTTYVVSCVVRVRVCGVYTNSRSCDWWKDKLWAPGTARGPGRGESAVRSSPASPALRTFPWRRGRVQSVCMST